MFKLLLTLFAVVILLTGCSDNDSNTTSQEENSPQISRTSTENNNTNEINTTDLVEQAKQQQDAAEKEKAEQEAKKQQPEEELASFSTKIYSKDSSRQNNVSLTCDKLNGTVVKNGASFSFTNTIGQATSSKGYEEADIFDANGNKKKGLGGGNCQVSSTLYNAVLKVSTLKVTERHEHSNKVPYVKPGKDAAVAYGSVDFKFKNESGSDIKIYAQTDNTTVTIRLVKI